MMKCVAFCFFIICAGMKYSFADVCSICDCKNDRLDCTNRKMSYVPDLKNVNKSIILFEQNEILHIFKLPKLRVNHLSFAYNYITTIDDSAFKNLYNLTSLDLSNNLLISTVLMPNVFKGNYQPDMYEPLLRLKELNLGNNIIHALHPHVFEHIPHLEKLILSGNPLNVIGQDLVTVFGSLPFLKELSLSNTSLKTLPENIFHSPKYLEVLDISYNLFKEIPRELESSHALRWLSLNGNPIQYIENAINLPFLRVLHLSKMPELIAIKDRSFSSSPVLEEFYCSYNKKLIRISKNVFSAHHKSSEEEGEIWPPLKVLVLNNNALQYIESHLVARWDVLKIINLQENPWMCDCENQWLVSTLIPIIENLQPEMLNSFNARAFKLVQRFFVKQRIKSSIQFRYQIRNNSNNKPYIFNFQKELSFTTEGIWRVVTLFFTFALGLHVDVLKLYCLGTLKLVILELDDLGRFYSKVEFLFYFLGTDHEVLAKEYQNDLEYKNEMTSRASFATRCSQPVEMKDMFIRDLHHRRYEMRCLDIFNHTPEYDGKLLIDILMISIVSTPIIMAVLLYYKRKRCIMALYSEALSTNYVNYSQLKIFPQKK